MIASDSPTNLAWLINNAQINAAPAADGAEAPPSVDFDSPNKGADGASFSEFALHLDDAPPR